MKLDSKYFDSIRAKPAREEPAPKAGPACQWKGCTSIGLYKAPVGRGKEGKYYLFCLDHVRQFNASYNYFEGWSSAEVEAFQKDAVIGHRPTWRTGTGPDVRGARARAGADADFGGAFADPHEFMATRSARAAREKAEAARRLKPLEKKSMDALGLAQGADKVQIKARFKELVKLHHPDANGGDKRSENKLREIIQAYNYLKQAGLV
ncbi:MAG TPA: J domain-containing protein [Hyphomicrobiaceae bacterium]|nr:J domain-containing protein [Hyphomicrobiaceae bacterium]